MYTKPWLTIQIKFRLNRTERKCLDSRPLCLPVEQMGHPTCSLVRDNLNPKPARNPKATRICGLKYFPFTGCRASPALGAMQKPISDLVKVSPIKDNSILPGITRKLEHVLKGLSTGAIGYFKME